MRLVVALVLLVTVAYAEDGLDVPGRDSTTLRGDALVWEDATFFLEPWTNGVQVRFVSLDGRRRDSVGRAVPVKIVSSAMRDFVEVELVEEPSCSGPGMSIDHRVSGLRLFVKRDDLAPVLVKPFAITYRNGTSAKLATGVPVMPTTSGAYVVSARGDKLRLPIPHASVGYTYPRGRVVDPPAPKGTLWILAGNARVTLGDDEIVPRAEWRATKPAKHSDSVKLKWATRCIELVVAVPARSLRRLGASVGGGTGYEMLIGRGSGWSDVPEHTIPRGTPLSTVNGREVAVTANEISVPPPVDGKSCFEAHLALHRLDDVTVARGLRLCAPAAALVAPPIAKPADDELAAPPDVAAPPSDARRTAKGVFYKRLVAGKGTRKPTADDTVILHYTGWQTDGTLIDSSLSRGRPRRFPLRAVIAGWTDGLQLMSIGDKVRFWIPEELAYQGAPGKPQGMLVFDVELLGIVD